VDPLLVIAPADLAVDPGGEIRTRVTVHNPGELVEQYRFTVLGDAARWSQVVPRDVSVLPGKAEEKSVEVIFRPPPAPAAPAGQLAFGIRCASLDRRDNCAVVEGDITVSAVLDLQADLEPVDAVGRWKGRFRLELRNTGSLPITVRIAVVDDADLLRFAIAPTEITVPARETSAVYLAVRPRTTKIVGKPVDHVVTVTYEVPDTDKAGQQQTTYQQRALIPKWLIISALAAVLVVIIVLAIMVFRPGADAGPQLTAGRPPPVGPAPTVTVLGPDSVQLDWEPNPYAQIYLLRASRDNRLVFADQVEAPIVSFVWTAIPGAGPTCFQVVPKNDNGEGPATPANCDVTLQGLTAAESSAASASAEASSSSASAAAASEAAASAASAATAAASAAAQASSAEAASAAAAAASSSVAASSSAAASSAAAASAAGSSVAATTFTPRRSWVIYYRTPVTGGVVQDAEKVTAALQQAGAQRVQLIESTTLAQPPTSTPFFLVIADDFPDEATAVGECAARNGVVPGVIACTVQPPA